MSSSICPGTISRGRANKFPSPFSGATGGGSKVLVRGVDSEFVFKFRLILILFVYEVCDISGSLVACRLVFTPRAVYGTTLSDCVEILYKSRLNGLGALF